MTFWTDETIQRVVSLYRDDKKPIRAIAREVGATPGMISGKLDRLNQKRNFCPDLLRERNRQETKAKRKQAPAVAPAPKRPKFVEPNYDLPLPRIEDVARKALIELEEGDCKWPIGDPRDSAFGFCALPAAPDHHYCEHHRRRSVEPNNDTSSA